MKRTFRTLLVLCCLALCLTFCLTACSDKCEHTYDNACDATCNECEETREVGAHDWSAATCTASKNCKICGLTEGEALGHEWTTPDVDLCEVESTCSRCGATDGENKEHSPETDDGNCATEVKCTVCGDVTTPAGQHTPNNDDGDCTTPITCSVCGTTTTPAKDNHTGGTATCVSGKVCVTCGDEYDTTKNPDNHTSTEFTYTENNDGTHTKLYACCEAVHTESEPHSFDENDKCLCGAAKLIIEQVSISGTDFPGGWSSDEEEDLK